jgi:predicted MFS family arabinose efflux permease
MSHASSAAGSSISSAAIPTRSIVALSVGACGSSAALRVCDPLLPRLADEFGVGLAAAARTVTAFAVAYGLLQLAYGPIGDRYGRYRTVTIAALASALTSFACAWAPSLDALVAARMLAGAAAGALIPLSIAWIGDVVPYERRQPVLARFLVGQMFGIAFGQLLGGIGADYFGPRTVFVTLGLWFVGTAWLMWRFGPARIHSSSARADGRIVQRFASVLKVRWARFVLATIYLEGVVLFGAIAFIPTHLHRAYGLPLTVSASIAMLYGVGGMAFAALSRILVHRLGEAGLAAGGSVLLATSLAMIAFGHVVLIAALCCFVVGFGLYMLHNTLQVNATQMAPAQRGSSLALFAACLFLGQSTGVTLAGYAADRFGTALTIMAAALLLLGLGLVFGTALRRRVSIRLPELR